MHGCLKQVIDKMFMLGEQWQPPPAIRNLFCRIAAVRLCRYGRFCERGAVHGSRHYGIMRKELHILFE
jgi:hypothetical protein